MASGGIPVTSYGETFELVPNLLKCSCVRSENKRVCETSHPLLWKEAMIPRSRISGYERSSLTFSVLPTVLWNVD